MGNECECTLSTVVRALWPAAAERPPSHALPPPPPPPPYCCTSPVGADECDHMQLLSCLGPQPLHAVQPTPVCLERDDRAGGAGQCRAHSQRDARPDRPPSEGEVGEGGTARTGVPVSTPAAGVGWGGESQCSQCPAAEAGVGAPHSPHAHASAYATPHPPLLTTTTTNLVMDSSTRIVPSGCSAATTWHSPAAVRGPAGGTRRGPDGQGGGGGGERRARGHGLNRTTAAHPTHPLLSPHRWAAAGVRASKRRRGS